MNTLVFSPSATSLERDLPQCFVCVEKLIFADTGMPLLRSTSTVLIGFVFHKIKILMIRNGLKWHPGHRFIQDAGA